MPGELRESFKTTPTSSFSSPSPNESEIVNDKDKTEQQTRHASKSVTFAPKKYYLHIYSEVSALFEPQGSNFQTGFLTSDCHIKNA